MDINIILAGYLEPGLLADNCWESVKTPLLPPPRPFYNVYCHFYSPAEEELRQTLTIPTASGPWLVSQSA